MKTIIAMRGAALLMGASLLATGAMAAPLQDGMQRRSETVQYKLPEATTPEGAAELYQQLRAAAERVCAQDAALAGWSHFSRESETACVQAALDKAVSRVGIASVSLLHMQSAPGARSAAYLRN